MRPGMVDPHREPRNGPDDDAPSAPAQTVVVDRADIARLLARLNDLEAPRRVHPWDSGTVRAALSALVAGAVILAFGLLVLLGKRIGLPPTVETQLEGLLALAALALVGDAARKLHRRWKDGREDPDAAEVTFKAPRARRKVATPATGKDGAP